MTASHVCSDPATRLRGGALLDRGFTSDVYAWGAGRVLKLFHHGTDGLKAEREYTATRAVHAMGLPVPAVHELIEIDGRRGIVMERVAGVSLFQRVQAKPWLLFAAVRQLAELHARINSCVAPATLPTQRERLADRIAAASQLSDAGKQHVLNCLNQLPDGEALCHGDFHPGNIMWAETGPVIIDWETATRGQPAGDAAYTSLLLQQTGLPPWTPTYVHVLLAATRSSIHRGYLKAYLRSEVATREQISKWQTPVSAEVNRRLDGAVQSTGSRSLRGHS
jgi:tRNA A-37 threonylcarbamoyl transferase component Bud32